MKKLMKKVVHLFVLSSWLDNAIINMREHNI